MKFRTQQITQEEFYYPWSRTSVIFPIPVLSLNLLITTGYRTTDRLLSLCPDRVVISDLAHICKREHSDRLLCPIRALKSYLKMTSSYHQNRTRLFLPIKGKQDISKSSRDGYLILLNLPIGNSLIETFPS